MLNPRKKHTPKGRAGSPQKLKATWFTHDWAVGQKAVKIFHGLNGYREAKIVEVTSVDVGGATIYVDEETGITYDANGREKENFFPGMHSEITPLEPTGQEP